MKKVLVAIILLLGLNINAQQVEKEYVHNTFEGTRVVVGHSIETDREGDMNFLISHKFGRVNTGAYEFFGLDQAIIRLGLDYAIKDWVSIGVGRSSLDKMLDGFVKVRLMRQQKGNYFKPVSITGLSMAAMNTLKAVDPLEPILLQNRMAYTHQIMIARQFSERFSVQLSPTYTHYNLVDGRRLPNDIITIGAATKLQLTKAIAFKAEYFYTLPNQLDEGKYNSLAIGFDFDTGSHVFQLHFSNAGGLVEPAFVGGTTGQWSKGDIHFGFTIARVFRLKGRRY